MTLRSRLERKPPARPEPEPKWRHRHWPARSVGNFVVSFPKSGRTWLRVMMAVADAETRGASTADVVAHWLASEAPRLEGEPILFTHALSVPAHEPDDASGLFLRYIGDRRRLFLVRDPRDTVVSNYFQATRRARGGLDGDLSTMTHFVRDPAYGVDRILRFLRACDVSIREHSGPALLLSYEGLHRSPANGLRAALGFFGASVGEPELETAVEYGRFDNMRLLERETGLADHNRRLVARSSDDPESFKTRKGAVGGYVEYLADEDIAYVEARIGDLLPKSMGYREPGVPPPAVGCPT